MRRDTRSVEEVYEEFERYVDAVARPLEGDPEALEQALSFRNPAFLEALGLPVGRWWRLGRWIGRRR